MIVHVAFWGLKREVCTPCPEVQPGRDPMHIWEMGPKDDCARCVWCHAVAWHTWRLDTKPVKAPTGPCKHGRAPEGPPCSRCPCPKRIAFRGDSDGHRWQSDGGSEGVSYRPHHHWCLNCHSVRGLP